MEVQVVAVEVEELGAVNRTRQAKRRGGLAVAEVQVVAAEVEAVS